MDLTEHKDLPRLESMSGSREAFQNYNPIFSGQLQIVIYDIDH